MQEQNIIDRLLAIVMLEGKKPLTTLGSYIVGVLVVDEIGFKLCQHNETLEKISEIGSDLEISNGNTEKLEARWNETKKLIESLGQSVQGQ